MNKPAISGKSKGKSYFNIKRRTPKVRNKGCVGIHGAREMARRKRQILRGQLKPENGLDLSYIPQYIFR
jgi:hypothetical protein